MGSGIAGSVCGEFLRSLCDDLAWDYAVFWKIRHQTPVILSWEDGYCNHPRPKPLPEFVINTEYFNRDGDAHSLLEDAKEHPLGSTVTVMSSLCYYVGKGLVGEMAETGNYCWLSCDDILFRTNKEISSAIPPEWLPQISPAPIDDNLEGGLFSLEEVHSFVESYSGGFYDVAADYCARSDLIALTYVDQVLNDIEDDILGNAIHFSMDCNLEEGFVSNMLMQENGASYNKYEDDYLVEADSSDLTSNSDNSPIELGNHDSLMETANNSRKRKFKPEETSVAEREDSVELSVMTTAFSTRSQDSPHDSSMTLSTLRSDLNIANEKDQVVKGSSNEFDQEKQERMAGCKRKVRPRPKPRDRQLIQDRVKELRELVPNGAKGSIDSLLARTVKHMLFLRSVTSRAEKLRKCTSPPEESAAEHQSRLTRALEIAGELQVCPIGLEDLKYPGLMLIEMLCNEHGLFLETTEVLRRLELNIIRGSTEARSDNIWASFVVEPSKGFHRVDISGH